MGKKKDVTIYCLDGSSYVTQLEKKKFSITKNDLILIGMASISIIFLAIFAYAPLYGLILAFREDRYINIIHNITYGKPVQFEHFKSFLTDPEFGNIMKNTLGLNILQLLINFPAPIVFAILLPEIRNWTLGLAFLFLVYTLLQLFDKRLSFAYLKKT